MRELRDGAGDVAQHDDVGLPRPRRRNADVHRHAARRERPADRAAHVEPAPLVATALLARPGSRACGRADARPDASVAARSSTRRARRRLRVGAVRRGPRRPGPAGRRAAGHGPPRRASAGTARAGETRSSCNRFSSPGIGMSSADARASAIAATSRFARSSARSTRWMKYRSPPLVASMPANRSTASTASRRSVSMSASRSASQQRSSTGRRRGCRRPGRSSPARGRDRSARRRSRRVVDRRFGKHSLEERPRRLARSSGRLTSVACIAVRNGVAVQQVDVAHRRRGVEHLAQRHVDAAVSESRRTGEAASRGWRRLPGVTACPTAR